MLPADKVWIWKASLKGESPAVPATYIRKKPFFLCEAGKPNMGRGMWNLKTQLSFFLMSWLDCGINLVFMKTYPDATASLSRYGPYIVDGSVERQINPVQKSRMRQ